MTRDQITAHFMLHDWEPMSAMGKKGPMRETGLAHPALGFLRVARGKHFAHVSKRKGFLLGHMHEGREPREWKQISLPKLRLMYARWELLVNADDAKESTHAP